MNKVSKLGAVVLSLIVLTGCYKVAEADYSIPTRETDTEELSSEGDPAPVEEQGDPEPDEEQEESEEACEPTSDPEAYLLAYVPKLYDIDESFHLYKQFGEEGDITTTDLMIRVLAIEIGDKTLSSEYDYLDEEDRPYYECGPDEILVYYTLEITAGEKHQPAGSDYLIGVNGTSLFSVGQRGIKIGTIKLFDFDYAFFSPVENADTVHDIGKITLKPGETKELKYAEKIRKEALEQDIYLNIDLLGFNLLDPDNTKPEDLTDEQRQMIAIYKVWEGKE